MENVLLSKQRLVEPVLLCHPLSHSFPTGTDPGTKAECVKSFVLRGGQKPTH